ncbi:MAG: FlgD immunoglobulin-like domain containing protein [bacterium]
MIRKLWTISIWCLTTSILSGGVAQAQRGAEAEVRRQQRLLALIQRLSTKNCTQDLSAPGMFTEPRYTQGATNFIYFNLPTLADLPLPAEFALNPFVITQVLDGSGESPLKFPKPVNLENDSTKKDVIGSLENGKKYTFTTALFVPVCTINCETVTDSSQLQLHCSAYEDSIWSIQDSEPPRVENVRIPQLQSSAVAGWWNQSTFELRARLLDAAGVWQGFLFRRNCESANWQQVTLDTTYPGRLTDSGFEFAESVEIAFTQNLADGCYEFRIEGRDAAHTPESRFPHFELAGNGGTPAVDSPAQIKIQIDTTPPASVSLNCEQIENTVQLNWTKSTDAAPGIGLAGYHIFRNETLIAIVEASQTQFIDTLSATQSEVVYRYQVQPFDSLANIQLTGGTASCVFRPVSQIFMHAEPKFTQGKSNRVCWRGSDLIDSYSVFMARDCDFVQAEMQTVSDTCFTFPNLEDGVKYCYWVTAVDRLQRSVFSDTVFSIQDAISPAIDSVKVLNTVSFNGDNWTTNRLLNLRIQARDTSPGEIKRIAILENGFLNKEVSLNQITNTVDTTLFVELISAACAPIELVVNIFDGAENSRTSQPITLTLDTTPPAAVTDLKCEQLLNANGIHLSWSPAVEPEGCSGLAGYRVLRDNNLIAELDVNAVQYDDLFSAATSSNRFSYRVLPFDFLGNVQTEGGESVCDYVGVLSIKMDALPEFSAGLSREICWEASGLLTSLKLFRDENGDFTAEDSVLVTNPPAGVSCHLFQNLADGQRNVYWIVGMDTQLRKVFSDTVVSIQDNTRPVIDDVLLPGADPLNNQLWTNDRNVKVQIVAHDTPPGEIWQYEISENGIVSLVWNAADSAAQLNETVDYEIQTQKKQPARVELIVQVQDGAENLSEPASVVVFLQESFTSLFAFPNPFNPLNDKITIRFAESTETEIKIYDFFGNLVRTVSEKANTHDFVWDGRNGNGDWVASGGYICVGTKTQKRFKIGVKKQQP